MIKKKICLIGAFAVGKTSLVQRYVHSIFSEKYHTTVGVKIDSKELVVKDRVVNMIIWDLHGEDDFQSVRTSYLRGASGCIYVVDGTRLFTMNTAIELRDRVTKAVGPIPSVLVVNKCDLTAQWEWGVDISKKWGDQESSILETSAKTGSSVELAFQQLAAIIMEME